MLTALVGAFGCASPPDIPVPDFARNVDRQVVAASHYQLAFQPAKATDVDAVRDFYGLWTAENGWRRLDASEESWSVDSWQSFHEEDGRPVKQLLVHWVDPSKRWSLRLALREYPDEGGEEAFAIVQPYENLDEGTWRRMLRHVGRLLPARSVGSGT